jgi:hypothetical protein
MPSDPNLIALTGAELEDLAFDYFCAAAFGSPEERERLEPSCQAILAEYRRRGLQTMTEGLLIARHEAWQNDGARPLFPLKSASSYIM